MKKKWRKIWKNSINVVLAVALSVTMLFGNVLSAQAYYGTMNTAFYYDYSNIYSSFTLPEGMVQYYFRLMVFIGIILSIVIGQILRKMLQLGLLIMGIIQVIVGIIMLFNLLLNMLIICPQLILRTI